MVFPRFVTVLASLGYAYAQTTGSAISGNTVQLFIDNMDPNAGWAASVQNACSGSTTYVLSCTSAPMNNACSPQTATITEGSDFFIVTTPAIYSETSATVTETCKLNTDEKSASCMATIVAGGYGSNITTTVNYNLTGNAYYQYGVQVTAGADHTKNGGACLAHVSGASTQYGQSLTGVIVGGAAILAGVVGIMAL
ncbi:hypothetical protein PRZ48_012352 [Zasmidium cellare]|uniref:Uncharacterized protein n=1 Tax=Zasmidium cellare TaxID=395010 RepID=A0ABR0E4P3_ZASCE|nr:hypothetical protein PRZ48_012352 [Zasmidium cellare]